MIGWVRRETTIRGVDKSEKLMEAVFDAKEKELGSIVESGDGFHVFRVEKREYVGVRPLDEVKDGIAAQLLVGERKGAIDKAFERLKEKYEIRLRKAGGKSSFKTMIETPDKKVDAKTRESMGEEELFYRLLTTLLKSSWVRNSTFWFSRWVSNHFVKKPLPT